MGLLLGPHKMWENLIFGFCGMCSNSSIKITAYVWKVPGLRRLTIVTVVWVFFCFAKILTCCCCKVWILTKRLKYPGRSFCSFLSRILSYVPSAHILSHRSQPFYHFILLSFSFSMFILTVSPVQSSPNYVK
jgi:hypothetical protein